MKTIRLLITFYKLFAFSSFVITLSCLIIIYSWGGETFTILFWLKVITLGLKFYYIENFKKDLFYYYKNLGLTKKTLWISTLTFDICVFLIFMILTLQIK